MTSPSQPASDTPNEAETSSMDGSVAPRAKLLGRRLPLAGEPPELVPARMVNEVLYCERLAYLEWAQGEWDDNAFTADGKAVHARVDVPGRTRRARGSPAPSDGAVEATSLDPEELPYRARSLWLSSERLGLTAKVDVLEGDGTGRVVPIEHKRGRRPDVPEGAYLPERAQLCAQVLLLRDHGFVCDEAAIWFAGDRQRVAIVIDDALVQTTLEAIRRVREVVSRAEMPDPLVASPRCNGCSLVGICLPDEVALLRQIEEPTDGPEATEPEHAPDPSNAAPAAASPALRRLHAARDERRPLYVTSPKAYVSRDGDTLVVKDGDQRVTVRLPNTSQVCIFGSGQVSTQAVVTLLERRIPLSYFTTGGWYLGRTTGHDSKNVELRVAQHAAARDPDTCLRLARGFVAAKILNARTLLRRNGAPTDDTVLLELKHLARKASDAASIESLLGVEGTAARAYFGAFATMLKGPAAQAGFDLRGRNRRPPRDPVNALLSLAYSLLSKDWVVTLGAVGLDPLLGFLHRPRFGRPALALDLMEELRPIVADSVVINALNTGVVGPDDFDRVLDACALRAPARRRFIHAYERRMDQEVTHPLFGYAVSYRRLLEIQARLLGRHLLGEIDYYPSFRTR